MRKLLSLVITLLFSHIAAAADVVNVFQLPLGGKPVIKLCSNKPIKLPCIKKRTKTSIGTSHAYIEMSESSVPEWAADAEFVAVLEKSGNLTGILVSVPISDNYSRSEARIVATMRERFGVPVTQRVDGAANYYSRYEWKDGVAFVSMICFDKQCDLAFRTHEERKREIQIEREDAARSFGAKKRSNPGP